MASAMTSLYSSYESRSPEIGAEQDAATALFATTNAGDAKPSTRGAPRRHGMLLRRSSRIGRRRRSNQPDVRISPTGGSRQRRERELASLRTGRGNTADVRRRVCRTGRRRRRGPDAALQ
mmetsp:Transcript_27949/g.86432  ORF Transcript_27949/g.86432 Transcript_27949/m.86432 type:complete len:120 (-) Transcript_27949:388-747(-)